LVNRAPQGETQLLETDVLIVGAGAGGLFAALGAKRSGPPGTRVMLLDTATVGRAGHTAFSNAGTIVAMPDENLDTLLSEIVNGNEGIADQLLVRDVLEQSFDRVRDLESVGVNFLRTATGDYDRSPTRGLDSARKMFPIGGGLEMCWKLRQELVALGVTLLDRFFVTGLLQEDGGRVSGAAGIHARNGTFAAISARATIIATNSVTFRPGFARDITGTGTLLAYKSGATLRNAEFSYARPGTPNFYFEGITDAVQDGAHWVNERGERFMLEYEPEWGDEADVPRVTRAMALEREKGHDPLYLDMSGIPDHLRPGYMRNKVPWMALFYQKLGEEARTNMFGRTPYYPMNQMTKMGVRTDRFCRSDVPGLLVAGLAQAGCANHFAGFHISMANGTGWIAGRTAVEDLDGRPAPRIDAAGVRALRADVERTLTPASEAQSDQLLRKVQTVMLACDVALWKRADRLESALAEIRAQRAESAEFGAPDGHEFVRLRETEAMLDAAEIILEASLFRTESRLAHLREDFERRDDEHWLAWVDVTERDGRPALVKTPIPTPLCAILPPEQLTIKRLVKGAT
jgi:succinate dehydrogenase/fumarate reductase flavoprotein subunit